MVKKNDSPLRHALIKFLYFLLGDKVGNVTYLREFPCKINTRDNYEFGELHRVYWDALDLKNEDPELIELSSKYVNSTELEITDDDIDILGYFLFFKINYFKI